MRKRGRERNIEREKKDRGRTRGREREKTERKVEGEGCSFADNILKKI